MNDSILTTIKKMLGPDETETHFDQDIIVHINTAIMTLTQLGVGPPNGFFINDASEKWSDFLDGLDAKKFQAVKTYIYIKVRLVFDPPTSATVITALEQSASQIESRLNYNAEGYFDF